MRHLDSTRSFLTRLRAVLKAAVAPETAPGVYICRPVLNGSEIAAWAARMGFVGLMDPADMHVTVAYSRVGFPYRLRTDTLEFTVADGYTHALGSQGAWVMSLHHQPLHDRFDELLGAGAQWDYDGYWPHITIAYGTQPNENMGGAILPYRGRVVLGPEVVTPLDEVAKSTVTQARAPAGSAIGGQWIAVGAGGASIGGTGAAPGGTSAQVPFAAGTSSGSRAINNKLSSIVGAFNSANPVAALNAIAPFASSGAAAQRVNGFLTTAKGLAAMGAAAAAARPPAPTPPTFGGTSTANPWRVGIAAKLTAASQSPNPIQALAAVGVPKGESKLVKYQQALLAYHGAPQAGTAASAPAAPVGNIRSPAANNVQPPTTVQAAAAPKIAAVTAAVSAQTAAAPAPGVPAPPALDTSFPLPQQQLFQQRVAALQAAHGSANPEAALQAIQVQTSRLIAYKQALLDHSKMAWEASPAGAAFKVQAAAAAKLAAAGQAAQAAAIAAGAASVAATPAGQVAATAYKPAKFTDVANHPELEALGRAAIAGTSTASRSSFLSLAASQGFDGKPTVVSAQKLSDVIAGGGKEIFRTVNGSSRAVAERYATQFRSGALGDGNGMRRFGQGLYFAASISSSYSATKDKPGDMLAASLGGKPSIGTTQKARDEAQAYGTRGVGVMMLAALAPQARVTTQSKLEKSMLDDEKRLQTAAATATRKMQSGTAFSALSASEQKSVAVLQGFKQVSHDIGLYALVKGYDGYTASNYRRHGYFVGLNRTAVVVSDQSHHI